MTFASNAANVDISKWARRLRDDPNPANRETAARELQGLNNPAALSALATAFLADPHPCRVRGGATGGQNPLHGRSLLANGPGRLGGWFEKQNAPMP